MENRKPSKKAQSVLIILAYKDGEQFIDEQLESIATQEHQNFVVKIFDDASDAPIILDDKKLKIFSDGQITVFRNKLNLGYSANFLKALEASENSFTYYSYCDQDDIWHPNKLSRAVGMLSKYDVNTPVLYCSRTEIYSSKMQKITGISKNFKKKPSFANAIVQNIAGGNTMIMNNAARDIVVEASRGVNVVSHDWWTYMLITGAGGKVIFDIQPSLKYRQHDKNEIGSNIGLKARFRRIRMLLNSQFKMWNDINTQALEKNKNLLLPENLEILEFFMNARKGNLFSRIYNLLKSGIHRQTTFGNVALWIAAVIKRL